MWKVLIGMGVVALPAIIKWALPAARTGAWAIAHAAMSTTFLRGRFGRAVENRTELTAAHYTCKFLKRARQDNSRKENEDIIPVVEDLLVSLKGEAI